MVINYSFATMFCQARLEKVSLHKLKYTSVSWSAAFGVNLFVVGQALDRRNARCAKRYAHIGHTGILAIRTIVNGRDVALK